MGNVPNILTVSRFLLTPVFIMCFFAKPQWGLVAALITVAIAQITDWLDGFIARRQKIVSDFGKLADPLADCVFNVTVFASFCAYELTVPPVARPVGLIPVWMLVVVITRELLMHAAIRPLASRYGVVMAAKLPGKIKTFVQGVFIDGSLLLMIVNEHRRIEQLPRIIYWSMMLVVVLTIFSTYGYVKELVRICAGYKPSDAPKTEGDEAPGRPDSQPPEHGTAS